MPPVYIKSKLSGDNSTELVKFLGFLCAAIIFSSLAFSRDASAQSTPESVLIEFQDEDTPPDDCIRGHDPDEALSCFWNNGYPYASICSRLSYSLEGEICPGPRVRIADFKFSDEIPFRSSLIQSLGGFERGQFYDHSQVLEFISILHDRLGVTDAEITFEQVGLSSVKMLVHGRAPRSSISAGSYVEGFDNVVARLSGRHFLGSSAPGFIEYYIQGSSNGLREIGTSMPIAVRPESTTRLGVRGYDAAGKYVDFRGTSLGIGVEQYSFGAAQIPRVSSYGGEIVKETLSAAGFIPRNDEYLSVFVNWELVPLNFFDNNELRLNTYLLAGHGTTSKLSLSASSVIDLSDNSAAVFRNFSNMELMFGSISAAPVSERIFLGGRNLRGFYPLEIGRTANENLTDWGERWSLTSQFELLWPLQRKFIDVSVGMHADVGFIYDENFEMESYGSMGLISDFGLSENVTVQLALSKNNFSRNNFSLFLNLFK